MNFLLQERMEKFPDAIIELGVSTLCFTYEVDDALREYWMPRDLLVTDSTLAPITLINVSLKKAISVEEQKVIAEEAQDSGLETKIQKTDNYSQLIKIIKKAAYHCG